MAKRTDSKKPVLDRHSKRCIRATKTKKNTSEELDSFVKINISGEFTLKFNRRRNADSNRKFGLKWLLGLLTFVLILMSFLNQGILPDKIVGLLEKAHQLLF